MIADGGGLLSLYTLFDAPQGDYIWLKRTPRMSNRPKVELLDETFTPTIAPHTRSIFEV
jgi:hypothetical protein